MSVPKLGPHMGRFQANVPVARGEVEGCRDRRRPGEVGNPPGFVKGHVAGPMGVSSRSAVIGWFWSAKGRVSDVGTGGVRISQPIRKVHLIQPNAPKSLQWSLFPDSTPIVSSEFTPAHVKTFSNTQTDLNLTSSRPSVKEPEQSTHREADI